jgi:hypothetical protein
MNEQHDFEIWLDNEFYNDRLTISINDLARIKNAFRELK